MVLHAPLVLKLAHDGIEDARIGKFTLPGRPQRLSDFDTRHPLNVAHHFQIFILPQHDYDQLLDEQQDLDQEQQDKDPKTQQC